MADNDEVLGIKATIDAKDVESEANKFIASIEKMQRAAEKSSDAMSDSFGFLLEQVNKLAPAIDAVKDRLASISGAMANNVAPKDTISTQAYDDIKSQVNALTSQNEALKAKLTDTTASIREQGKATDTTASSLKELNSVSQETGSSNGIASIGNNAKKQMKELADEIKIATESIKAMQESYAQLESKLANLERRKYIAENNPISDNPIAQRVKNYKVGELDSQIEDTKMSMSRIKQDMTEYKAEIVQCNQKMSELSNTTAQTASRTVGLRTQLREARQHVSELILSGQQGTIEFGKAVNEANKLQAAFNKASMAISGKSLAVNSLNMLSTSISGVTGAMTTYMGVAGLFASNQEDLVKIQTKLQAVMSLSMGVQQMLAAATQISVKWDTLSASIKATIAAESTKDAVAKGAEAAANTAEATTAAAATTANVGLAASIKAVATAIYTSVPVIGWILAAIAGIVAGCTALYKYLTRLTPAQKAAAESAKYMAEQQKKVQETMRNQYATVGESIAKYKKLQAEYNNVKSNSKELNQFIKDNASEFKDMNLSVKNASDAENVFVRNSSAVINGLNMRAKAAAQYQVAVELYTEAFKKQIEAEQYDAAAGYTRTDLNKYDNNKRKRQYRATANQNRKDADKLSSQADAALRASVTTQERYQSYMKANGISTYKADTKKNKSSKNEKSAEQIAYENAQKWHELQIEETKAYQDKLSELSEAMLSSQEDSAEKNIAEIRRNRDKQLMELDEWVTELARKRKEVAKGAWINAGKNRTEYGWSQTKQGQMTDEDWKADLFQNNKQISSVYDSYSAYIQDNAASEESKAIDKVIEQYNKDAAEKQKKVKALREDIAFLEKEIKNVTNEAQKANMEIAKNNAQSQLEWLEQSKDAWNEYYTKYGTFTEKIKALDDQFSHDTIGMDKNSPEYKKKEKERDTTRQSLVLTEVKSQMNWEQVFGDLSSVSKSALAVLEEQLTTLINNSKDLSIESIKELSNALDKVREEQAKKGGLAGVVSAFGNLKNARNAAKQTQSTVENVGGGSLWKKYNAKGASVEDKAKLKEAQVYDPVTNKLTTFGKMLDKASKAAKDLSTAQKNAQSSIKGVGNDLSNLGQIGNNTSELLGKFGINLPDGFGTAFSGLSAMGEAMESFDMTNPGSLMNINNYVKFASGMVDTFTGMFEGIANLFGSSGMKEYEDAKKERDKMTALWDDLIDKKKEYLNLSYGAEAIKAANDIEGIYKADLESLDRLGLAYIRKHAGNAHSAGYRMNKSIGSEGFAEWSKVSGQDISTVQDFFDKDWTYQQLVDMKMADNGKIWANLDEEMQGYLDELIDIKKNVEDLGDTIKERLTGVSFDEFKNNFISVMKDMNSSATDMTNNFKQNLRDAIIDTMIDKKFKDRLQKLYDDFASANEDGEITKEEYDRLVDEESQLAADMQAAKQQYREQYGWTSDETTSGTSKGFSAMTQDQAGELNGRFTAMNEIASSILATCKVDSEAIGRLASSLTQIVTIEVQRSAYYDESIEIQRTSVSHLAAISKNTYELYGMHEKLTKIEQNTRNL